MSDKHFLRILIAPLDWGLGHSTRCIPIIKLLTDSNCTVIIAAEGHSRALLQAEFSDLTFLPLSGYNIQYTNHKRFLPLKILSQLPKMLRAVYKEHQWLKTIITQHKIDAVISDNRYGLWSKKVPAIIITHQLQIKGPNKWIEWLLRKANYHQINRFKNCWIPDYPGEPNLAGKLSHPVLLPAIPVKYIGPLSRCMVNENAVAAYDVMIVISGPEPQRTLFEKLVIQQLKSYNGKALLVRGLPSITAKPKSFNQVDIVNHIPAAEMSSALQASQFLISRAGYTTVMDVVKLGIKSILIATPGQTEQEYLVTHLQDQGICLAATQEQFNLNHCLQAAASFQYKLPPYNMELYKEVVKLWLDELRDQKK